ncbi:MAG: hypothetical protein KKA62_03220 [Nanoarchaeota archaeon]|nr:hypothetical protein [Nanoarchaeota archaeon]MBU1643740.1 hypothetical protein [Nanoarchaeota archaeon]MBU1976936.1 hypothetical protein [Nanoarchaeota archaeon]
MKDVSNKTIVALLAVALVVTVLGTVVSVNKLGELSGKFNLLSGAATTSASGLSNLTISQSTSITNQFSAIEFGSGYVTVPGPCVIDSNGVVNGSGNYCVGFNNPSSGFLLENTGNVNLSVNYTCSGSCTAASFIGGTSPVFQIWATDNLAAGQAGENVADTVASCANGPFSTTPAAVSAAGTWLCGNSSDYSLDSTDAQDAFVVDLNVSIPADAPTGSGVQTATFTFNALATG